jgi:phosphoribosylanthranilate isomerase
MSARVKICGLKTDEAVRAALDAGADLVGLVFHAKSPRNVSIDAARPLADLARGRAEIVALVVDPTDETLRAIVDAIRPGIIQLHGNETPERVREIRKTFGTRVMKAIQIGSRDDAERARAFADATDLLLFDAKAPPQSDIPGGNGEVFDWTLIEAVKDVRPWVLAAGLTPANVAEAIRRTGAPTVDVSSGVERARGEKDPELVRAFVKAAQNA